MRCKWCRKGIIPGWETLFGELIAPWVHVSGYYSCFAHGQHQAEPADLSWERVYAYVRPVQLTGDELFSEGADYWKNILEFRVDVRQDTGKAYSIQRIHKDDLADWPDLYAFVLDKMVVMIDDTLSRLHEGNAFKENTNGTAES